MQAGTLRRCRGSASGHCTGQASAPLHRFSPWQGPTFLLNSRSPPFAATPLPGEEGNPSPEVTDSICRVHSGLFLGWPGCIDTRVPGSVGTMERPAASPPHGGGGGLFPGRPCGIPPRISTAAEPPGDAVIPAPPSPVAFACGLGIVLTVDRLHRPPRLRPAGFHRRCRYSSLHGHCRCLTPLLPQGSPGPTARSVTAGGKSPPTRGFGDALRQVPGICGAAELRRCAVTRSWADGCFQAHRPAV